MDYSKWLAAGLKKPDKDVKELARKLKIHPSGIYKMMDSPPKRKIRADELIIISQYIEEAPPGTDMPVVLPKTFVTVPIDGTVEAGSFREADMIEHSEQETFAIRDEIYPKAKHVAYEVRGDSMELERIHDGDTIICIDFQDAGGTLSSGMKVVVEQNRGGLIERSVKVAMVFPDRTEFQPRSNNPRHKPIVYKNKKQDADVEVRVLAIVRRVTREV